MRRLLVAGAALLVATASACAPEPARFADVPGSTVERDGRRLFVPDSGIVRDSATAAAIGAVYIASIYGSSILEAQRPLRVTRDGGDWVIRGTLPPDHVGGTATVRLSRSAGTVLELRHGL
ncbi:MAG: hypothetical protein KF709_12680 [Gemmatimonadaceae bacterium]|nr:hypothetical protein [Gemmatimonadaceae bacterium]